MLAYQSPDHNLMCSTRGQLGRRDSDSYRLFAEWLENIEVKLLISGESRRSGFEAFRIFLGFANVRARRGVR